MDELTIEELVEMEKDLKAEQEADKDYEEWKDRNQGW